MSKFWQFLSNEIKYFFTDHGVVLIMVIGVMAYSLCYAVPYFNELVKEAPISVVDMDRTKFSNEFIKDLDTTDSLMVVEQNFSINEAEDSFYKDNIKGFVVIPKNFEKDILSGKQTNIALYADSAYMIIYKTIYSAVLQTSIENGAKIEIAKMMKSGVPKKQAIALKQPFEFVQMPLFNPAGGYKTYVYPIILVLILHQTLLIGTGLVQGRRNELKKKYCNEDKDIPIAIFAKSTFYVFLYTIYAALFFLVYPAVFDFPMSYNIIPLILLYFLMMYSVAFFGQTLSYWFRTRETVILTMVPMSIIFIFVPGLLWPKEAIPAIINFISLFIPATCSIDGIVKINQNNAQFTDILYDVFWLMFLCIFYFITANYLTKKNDDELNS